MPGGALLIVLVGLVTALVVLSARYSVNVFILLLGSALVYGLLAGMGLYNTLETIEKGFGSTLGGVGIVIILGAVIGVYLERSGASNAIARSILKVVGRNRAPAAMSFTGVVVSIPVFCDSAFIVLSPLLKALSRTSKSSRLMLAVCLATGLFSTHCLVPPTPGPIAAAEMLNADLGRVVILGLPLAVLLSGVGYLWAKRFSSVILPGEDETPEPVGDDIPSRVSTFRAYLPVALPLLLISFGSVTRFGSSENTSVLWLDILNGIGHPVFALSIGVLAAVTLPRLSEKSGNAISEAILLCAQVLAVTAAGGAFGLVIRESALGGWLQQAMSGWRLGVLVPFMVAAAIKSAQGSSTVALITASAMVAPLLEPLGLSGSAWGPALTVAAVGCGAMCVSHANDSYFWVVSQMAGIPPQKAYGSYTAATGLMGLCGAIAVFILSIFLT